MAKKIFGRPAPTAAPVSTEVRNTAIPKLATPKREVTHDAIARRAYELWQQRGGAEMENWLQAERELRAGR